MSFVSGKKVTVVGMGLSGVAAVRLLHREGAQLSITDDRTEEDLREATKKLEDVEIDYRLGGIDSDLLLRSDLIVISPGVPSGLSPIEMARKAGVEIISYVELANSFCDAPLIAVTGTNGKTTTTALACEMAVSGGMRAVAAGNIEIPFAQVVCEETFDLVVLEVSSFQLENIKGFSPMVGAVLNLSPDHLDRYRGMEDYIAAKMRLFENQSDDDHAVLNRDDPAVTEFARDVRSRVLWFSTEDEVRQGAFLRGETLVSRFGDVESEIMKVEDIPLMGRHNVANVLAAIAATLPFELPSGCYRPAVAGFSAAEHRLEKVRELNGVLFVNDSKATNIGALEKSLDAFDMPIILIAGGRGKRGGYRELRPLVESKVKTIVTIGEDAAELEEAFGDIVPSHRAETLPEAVEQAAKAARPGDCVLLAPGCASFDMFTSYAHRGRVFKEAVETL